MSPEEVQDHIQEARAHEARAVAHLEARRAYLANGFIDQAYQHFILADAAASLAIMHRRLAHAQREWAAP